MTELTAALLDSSVWISIATALTIGAACLLLGVWISGRLGILRPDAQAGEVLGIGLGSGLVIAAVMTASIMSRGRSAYLPVGIAFAACLAAAFRGKDVQVDMSRVVFAAITAAALVVALGFIFGVTMAPSPREGLQPVEFFDNAYYSNLAVDLARTGQESMQAPSGFTELPGLPLQSWYHWGEVWLAAGILYVLPIDPVIARHYIVLPLILTACATLGGAFVRRLAGTTSLSAFIFGAAAILFLAPVPLPGPYFASWPRGLIFGVTMYGLGALVVLLLLVIVVTRRKDTGTFGEWLFVAAVAASLLPSHVVLAVLAAAGLAWEGIIYVVGRLARWRVGMPTARLGRRPMVLAIVLVASTVLWGFVTGHGLGVTGLSPSVLPFNDSWRESLAMNLAGSGAYLAIPAAWFLMRHADRATAFLLSGTLALLTFGAVAWGARLGDFTMFHVFYGGIAVFGTPVAAAAIWLIVDTLKRWKRRRVAVVIWLLALAQLEVGAAAALLRMQQFGTDRYAPVPTAILDAIEDLPADARLAYACDPFEERAFWNPRLGSIAAHTGKHVVPMCFEAEYFPVLTGADAYIENPSPYFAAAPQRSLYPNSSARPSAAAVTSFLDRHRIHFIYTDTEHPNVLVPSAVPVVQAGEFAVLRVP